MRFFGAGKKDGNYAYACTRVKSRKTFLLTRDTYPRLLMMDLAEIGRFIGEGQYRREVDELSSRFAGVDLVENATYLNLARTCREILDFTQGELREMVRHYLNRWDVWNIKTVMRAKSFGATWEEVSEDLVPAGAFDLRFFSSLYGCATQEEMVEQLRRAAPGEQSPVGRLPAAGARTGLADLENAMDRQYYAALLASVPAGVPANRIFRRYIAAEIDTVNLKTLFKLKFEGVAMEKAQELLIAGGEELGPAELGRLAGAEGFEAFLSELSSARVFEGLREAAGRAQQSGSLNDVLLALDRGLAGRARQFSHLYPLSVLPIIDYLLRKRIEVDNLRTIARGKQSGLPEEEIRGLLFL
ncbi:MAG: ATP synthase A1 subunit C [Euryarchaeota archaeon]|nr:ATP synthase A1 subunit C [Euryarchaeota archaeon]